MKKQEVILLASCWGVLPYLILYIRELGEDSIIPMFEWLQSTLGLIGFFLHWAYFLPAFVVTFVLRIPLYVPMILILPANPSNPATWVLPVVCWFGLINVGVVLYRRFKRRDSNKNLEHISDSANAV